MSDSSDSHRLTLTDWAPPVVIFAVVVAALFVVNRHYSECEGLECILPGPRSEPEAELYAAHRVKTVGKLSTHVVSGAVLYHLRPAKPGADDGQFSALLLVHERSGAVFDVQHTDLSDAGRFEFEFSLPKDRTDLVVNVSARRVPPCPARVNCDAPRHLASATLEIGKKSSLSRLSLEKDGNTLRMLFGIFTAGLLSIVLVRLWDGHGSTLRGRLVATMIFARLMLGCFAATMALVMIRGYHILTSGDLKSELISIGLGYIHKGRFAGLASDDWLYMLDNPLPGEGVLEAVGAPVWVIVLSTFGAGIMVTEFLLKDVPDLKSTDEKVDLETNGLARQFLAVAFAPLGAIFVYQFAVKLGIANREFIAVAALASGLAMTRVVELAVDAVRRLFDKANHEKPKDDTEKKTDDTDPAQKPV